MAGWLAIAISNDFGCNLGSMGLVGGDGWENTCCTRTPNTQTCQYTTTESTNKTHDHMAGWLALEMSNNSSVTLNRQETAGSWLGDGWVVAQWLFRKIAGVVLDRCKMAGRWQNQVISISLFL